MGSDFVSMWREQDAKQAARIAELESIVKNFDAFVAALAAIGPHAGKPDSHIEALLDKVNRVSELEQTERELRDAVKVLGNRIRVGSELHEFMRTEYSQRDKDRKAMNRKRARMKTALFVACDEVDANPIAAAAVREAGR